MGHVAAECRFWDTLPSHAQRDAEAMTERYGDAPLPDIIDALKADDKVASVLSVRPPYTTHVLRTADDRLVSDVSPMNDGSLRINGGYFVFRNDIFDDPGPGEDLVEEPFQRPIAAQQLVGYRYEGLLGADGHVEGQARARRAGRTPRPPWAVWLRDEDLEHAPSEHVALRLSG